MTSDRMQRLSRGAATATFATFAALAGHVVGGGAMPGLLGLVAPLVLSVVVCTFLSGQRLSATRLIASVAVAQIFFHLLFVLGTPSGAGGSHHHSSARDAALALDALPLGALPVADANDSPGLAMWLGHALAVLTTSAALFWAERVLDAVAALAERMRSRVLRCLTVLTTASPVLATLPAVFADVATPHLEPRLPRASRRGPPLAAS